MDFKRWRLSHTAILARDLRRRAFERGTGEVQRGRPVAAVRYLAGIRAGSRAGIVEKGGVEEEGVEL